MSVLFDYMFYSAILIKSDGRIFSFFAIFSKTSIVMSFSPLPIPPATAWSMPKERYSQLWNWKEGISDLTRKKSRTDVATKHCYRFKNKKPLKSLTLGAFYKMVPSVGLEPTHHRAQVPKTCVSTNSTSSACNVLLERATRFELATSSLGS